MQDASRRSSNIALGKFAKIEYEINEGVSVVLKLIGNLIHKKLLVNLIVVLLVCLGVFTALNINREGFPEVNFDMVTVTTIYPGASPDEIEQLIAIPIEKKLREVNGIDKLRAYNIENVSVFAIYLEDKSDKDEVVDDIKDAIDSINDFPVRAEASVVKELKLDKTIAIQVALYGKRPGVAYHKIKSAADHIENFFYEIDGVADVEIFGDRDREYLVEVDPAALQRNRIGINTITDKLQSRNIDLPGGALKIRDKEYVLRTKGQFQNITEIRNTVIQANDLGFVVRLKDVATVMDTFEDPDIYERFNGRKAIIVNVYKKRSADEIRMVDAIREKMKTYTSLHADEVAVEIFEDTSEFTKERISSVLTNALTGFVLLALILLMLLGVRMASIVSMSIPISIMVAFVGMSIMDITINVVSLFGMVMVLGMIVDFGIVVSENSHRYMEQGLPKVQAIQKGVTEVFWPVTVTLLCISAAFSPILFLSGIIGKFIWAIPAVLLICLFASWVVAMFVLPTYLNTFAHAASTKKPDACIEKDENCERGFFGRIQLKYKGFLKGALKHRYVTLFVLILMLVGSLYLGTRVGFVFMPDGGAENMQVIAKLPQGTHLDATLREVRKLEKIILEIPEHELESLQVRVGTETASILDPKPGAGTNKATFQIALTSEKKRKRDAYRILEELRHQVARAREAKILPDEMELKMTIQGNGPPVGKPINVEIRGQDIQILKEIALKYTAYLEKVEGVKDINFDLEEGKTEYRYTIDEEMAAKGQVSARDIATTLHAAFSGSVATNVQQGEEDIDIRVRFPEKARQDKESLKEVLVANKMDGLIPLSRVSKMTQQPGYSMINRLDFKRIVQVQAEVDTHVITSLEANRMLKEHFAALEKAYPEYNISYGGEQEDTNESMGELGVLFIFALFVIFIILAVFMNSLIMPIVVMSAIPFGLVGMMIALWAHHETISFMSTLGFFSLAGVIVSNTLVLVEFINIQRKKGLPIKEALLEAGVLRLRPVLLTSGTTVLGLLPTIYGLGGKDHFVAPLALAFGYGLVFATFITLVLIPCLYHIAEDYKRGAAKVLGWVGIKMDGSIYRPVLKTGMIEEMETQAIPPVQILKHAVRKKKVAKTKRKISK